jgi:hypothetical protein
MNTHTYVWHGVPKHMQGDTIYSLSGLRSIAPELAEHTARKYIGREQIAQQFVAPLQCYWHDIIFLTPYHPNEMQEAYKNAGFNPRPIQFYQIPIHELSTHNIVWWLPSYARSHPEETYKAFSPSELPLPFPEEQKLAYARAFEKGFHPLLYAQSPHLCLAAPVTDATVKGLCIKNAPIIEV